ncbi:flagellar assembly peptidoglycan hydrolase FlgJ [Buttiauxella warmboldiae]|uniref:Peptidoglycan hydrolase FlgJ n=1 Tax=Buttiauxella warmboldiae TaxID=82993 RepID=A0A3N5DPU7_9ENTR|nr:flagellar assembly peptidoglycan hydrolase FlgJ [Buttiauxella warmboldiae]RPH29231.1 flagellar assembly peptidoglycan hydrolase FlgJ [Buttiauxella warmboldiae]
MANLSLVSGAAFDIRGLDGLKREVKNHSGEGLKAAAKQMEGIFIQMMLKSMREASFKDGLFNSDQSDMFTAMYDQQVSQDIAAQSKMGFADLMIKQMGGEAPTSQPTRGAAPAPYVLNQTAFAATKAKLSSLSQKMDIGLNQQTVTTSIRSMEKNTHFISKMLEPALATAKKSGIPHLLIIAQAALESGWGNREITTAEGKKSHNLFGVKATPAWKGESTEITTTELINGTLQKVKAAFKVYPSYSSALDDYIALLTHNPLYHNVARSGSPEKAAQALQSAGYATDPDYAQKLINIMHKVKLNISHGLDSCKTDLSSIF